jgi:hypothetical protein
MLFGVGSLTTVALTRFVFSWMAYDILPPCLPPVLVFTYLEFYRSMMLLLLFPY